MSYLEEHRNEIFKKYSTEDLKKDVISYQKGKGRLSKVLNQFFEECIFNSVGQRGKKSPMEALDNDEDVAYMLEYINRKTNFYTGSEIINLKSFFRNAGKLASKVANFCPKTARDIYFRYNEDNDKVLNCLDTSCGFGSRMSSVLLTGHNYFGFDPNTELFKKLNECCDFYREEGFLNKDQICKLYCQGSETFAPELVGMIDVSFTSPPYFDYEIYSQDEGQSCNKYTSYDLWLENFAKPTIINTYEYLKVGGIAMINIKNLTRGKKYPLFDDWFNIFSSIDGFELVEVFNMKHQSKKLYSMNANYTEDKYKGFEEPVMVFKKVR